MDNDPLIEIIAKRIEAGYIIMSNPENARRDAQAALAALKAEGYMLCKWKRTTDSQAATDAFNQLYGQAIEHCMQNGYRLTGLEPPKGE